MVVGNPYNRAGIYRHFAQLSSLLAFFLRRTFFRLIRIVEYKFLNISVYLSKVTVQILILLINYYTHRNIWNLEFYYFY